MLNVRLAVFFLPTFAVMLRPDPRRLTTAVLIAVAIVVTGTAAEAAVEVRGAARDEVAGIDALLARVTPGARLVLLEFDRGSRYSDFSPWIHLGALHRLRGGGVASVSFAEVPHWPIRFRPATRPPRVEGRSLEWQPCEFRNTLDGVYFDYVLARGAVDPFEPPPPGPRWRRAGQAGAWALYEKTTDEAVASTEPDRGPCVER